MRRIKVKSDWIFLGKFTTTAVACDDCKLMTDLFNFVKHKKTGEFRRICEDCFAKNLLYQGDSYATILTKKAPKAEKDLSLLEIWRETGDPEYFMDR